MTSIAANSPIFFQILVKPAGAVCNLDCKYCFFLSKEKLYPGSHFRMTEEILQTYIKQLLEYNRLPEVAIAWQGGEPTLMGVDFFRRADEYVKMYRKPGEKLYIASRQTALS